MFVYVDGMERLGLASVLSLYQSVNWTNYTDRPDVLYDSLANSTFVVSCWDGERLTGLARSLSDDHHIHYLQDVLVDPEYQRRGIGAELMKRCLERFAHVRAHVLLTDDEERQKLFYEAMGYKDTRDITKFQLRCFVKFRGVD